MPKQATRQERFRRNFWTAVEKSGKSLAELSRETGIAIEVLSRWKTQGRMRCKQDNLNKVGDALNVEPGSLFADQPKFRRPVVMGEGVVVSSRLAKILEDQPELREQLGQCGLEDLAREVGHESRASKEEILRLARQIVWRISYLQKASSALKSHRAEWLANAIDMALRD